MPLLKLNRILSLVLILGFPASAAFASESFDWPQWRGPDRNAASRETGLLQEWPESGPPLTWKITGLGGGYSTPSVANGRIYGMSSRGEDEVIWSISENDGSELWVTRLGSALTGGMPQGKEGSGCTPTVDGNRLYVLGLSGDLVCLESINGKILWRKNLTADFGGILPTWRYNESPLIDGEKVVVTPGGDKATLVALNKMTGETIWTAVLPNPPSNDSEGSGQRQRGGRPGMRDSGAGYSSAIAIDYKGQRQYVQFTSKALAGFAASNGELLWRYDRPANRYGINCSTPVHIEGKILAASAYRAGGGLVQLSQEGDRLKANEVWFSKNMENHHGGMLVIDGAVYGSNGGNGGGYLICLDFQTGDVLWNEKDPDKRRVKKGSVALADGRIYYRTEDGVMVLIEPSRMAYIERGRFEQPDRTNQPAWTHPIIANGKLYIRDQNQLFCYDVKQHDQ
ncbi:MAG: PQQ-like beta-propeller repeat protein [Verrucomicrobia bacterium]|nr:PQQ-like beta-propeller repeat protein [Verrucomicrobiota bacterium]